MQCAELAAWVEAIGTWLAAIATFLAIVVALFQDCIKAPRLELSLKSTKGVLEPRQNGGKALYYHVAVRNRRPRNPAWHVKVSVTGLEKKTADGQYRPVPLVVPMQLHWAYGLRELKFREQYPTVFTEDTCDLLFLDQGAPHAPLATYVDANQWGGTVGKHESMRISLDAVSDNSKASAHLTVEVSWDGIWVDDPEAMQDHLVIGPV
jgi:hypothetical protein